MVVWRYHGVEPPPEHMARMHAKLREVATRELGEIYLDDHIRKTSRITITRPPERWLLRSRLANVVVGALRPPEMTSSDRKLDTAGSRIVEPIVFKSLRNWHRNSKAMTLI